MEIGDKMLNVQAITRAAQVLEQAREVPLNQIMSALRETIKA